MELPITFIILFLLLFSGMITAAGQEAGDSFTVTESLPAELHLIFDHLFDPDHFVLLGKLITLFLREEEKAYLIERISANRFAIRSKATIRAGSLLQIEQMTGTEFVFSGQLILKKGIEFNCAVQMETIYRMEGRQVTALSKVFYQLPPLVRGLDRTIRVLTGQHFVVDKTTAFLQRMHLALARLAELSPAEWESLARQEGKLSSLIYPVSFSKEEIGLVRDVLQLYHTQKSRDRIIQNH